MAGGLMIEASIIGDAEVAQHFLDFGDGVRVRLRSAMAALGRSIADTAASLAPHRTGDLAGAVSPKQVESNQKIVESVAPRGREGFIGRLMEFGVVNHGGLHNRSGVGGKRLKALRIQKLRSAGSWRIRPRPFMGPAMEAHRSRIESTLAAALEESVAEANR